MKKIDKAQEKSKTVQDDTVETNEFASVTKEEAAKLVGSANRTNKIVTVTWNSERGKALHAANEQKYKAMIAGCKMKMLVLRVDLQKKSEKLQEYRIQGKLLMGLLCRSMLHYRMEGAEDVLDYKVLPETCMTQYKFPWVTEEVLTEWKAVARWLDFRSDKRKNTSAGYKQWVQRSEAVLKMLYETRQDMTDRYSTGTAWITGQGRTIQD